MIVLDNGLYGYEQFLVDRSYFHHPSAQPKPYVALNRWDFVAFAQASALPRPTW